MIQENGAKVALTLHQTHFLIIQALRSRPPSQVCVWPPGRKAGWPGLRSHTNIRWITEKAKSSRKTATSALFD